MKYAEREIEKAEQALENIADTPYKEALLSLAKLSIQRTS